MKQSDRDMIRIAMEKNLSGLHMKSSQRSAILERIQEGRKMKRKIPVALVLAIVLVLLAVTAVALSNWEQIRDYLTEARDIARETVEWQAADKIRLVEAMRRAGLDMDENAYAQLQNALLTEEEKDAIADAIITARYGKHWEWTYNAFESVEWPDDVRLQSEENARAYDQWNDAYDRAHKGPEARTVPIADAAEALTVMKNDLNQYLGFYPEDDLPAERLTVSFDEDARLWKGAYLVQADDPGQYVPTATDQDAEASTVLERLQDLYGMEESYTVYVRFDAYEEQLNFRFQEMEVAMEQNMTDELTEIYGFENGSFDPSQFVITHYPEYGVWEATYTITEENPGLYCLSIDEIEAGIPQSTVLEARRQLLGEKITSYTFHCLCDENNRHLAAHTLDEYLANQESINYQPAINQHRAEMLAKTAVMNRYHVSQSAIDGMKVEQTQDRTGPQQLEYIFTFLDYHYDAQMNRLWEYEVGIDADSGEILSIRSRAEEEAKSESSETIFSGMEADLEGYTFSLQRLRDADAVYLAEGGARYHFLADCPSEKTPLQAVVKAEAAYRHASPCPYCVKDSWFWPLKDQIMYAGAGCALPDDAKISMEKALQIAREAAEKSGFHPDELYPSLRYYIPRDGQPYYVVFFCRMIQPAPLAASAIDPVCSVVINGETGEVTSSGKIGSNG
ncbi:MAG: hypothetical protein IJ189_06025 [Clostridia bacterium]|nr:hypothetical protein [Clostridia bacterium]